MRLARIALGAALVAAAEWRLLARAAGESLGGALPWALAALLVPLGIGAWAFEVTAGGRISLKIDALWALVAGSAAVAAILLLRLLGS